MSGLCMLNEIKFHPLRIVIGSDTVLDSGVDGGGGAQIVQPGDDGGDAGGENPHRSSSQSEGDDGEGG